jgi:hypothetical protein
MGQEDVGGPWYLTIAPLEFMPGYMGSLLT